MRYFVKTDINFQPVVLYRFNLDVPDSISEEIWKPIANTWEPSERIVEVLTQGSADFDEVSEELARKTFPDAFSEVSKSIGEYEVSKAEGDKRYTLGAMYIPDRLDAHGEWTDAEELQKAVWDYVRTDDRRIRLQHNRDIVAGEWVEVMAFPYELTVPISTPSGIEVNHTYPPNTVFLGVVWEPWAWEKIQNGEILGYSIGGRAERLYVDMEKADGPTVSDVHVDTVMNQPKKKKKVIQDEEVLVEKEKPIDIKALTDSIIETIKKDMPAPVEPVIIEKSPTIDIEAMMIKLAEIMSANQPVINVVMPEEKPKNRKVERDEFGNISRIIEEE